MNAGFRDIIGWRVMSGLLVFSEATKAGGAGRESPMA